MAEQTTGEAGGGWAEMLAPLAHWLPEGGR